MDPPEDNWCHFTDAQGLVGRKRWASMTEEDHKTDEYVLVRRAGFITFSKLQPTESFPKEDLEDDFDDLFLLAYPPEV